MLRKAKKDERLRVANAFEKSREVIIEKHPLKFSNQTILARAGFWSGESNSKMEGSWGVGNSRGKGNI